MAAGIKVINNDGYLQIDENYSNLYLSRIVKLSLLPKETRLDYYILNLQDGEKLVGVCASKGEIVVEDLFYQHADNVKYYVLFKGNAEDVMLYIYGEKPTSTGKSGFRVFDAKGACVFDSNYKYMRIVKFSNATSDSYTLDASKKYAVCTFGYNILIIENSQPFGVAYFYTMPIIENNRLEVVAIHTQDGKIIDHWLTQRVYGSFNMFSYFLIDVT